MLYSQTSLPSSWRATKGSASGRRRPQEGLNTGTNTHQKSMSGVAFQSGEQLTWSCLKES